jgi:hypothetical protein
VDEIRRLFDRAQDLEEMADSRGGDAQLYRAADAAWQRAFDAAERDGGAQLLEGLVRRTASRLLPIVKQERTTARSSRNASSSTHMRTNELLKQRARGATSARPTNPPSGGTRAATSRARRSSPIFRRVSPPRSWPSSPATGWRAHRVVS